MSTVRPNNPQIAAAAAKQLAPGAVAVAPNFPRPVSAKGPLAAAVARPAGAGLLASLAAAPAPAPLPAPSSRRVSSAPAFNPSLYACAVCTEKGDDDEGEFDPILKCSRCDMWVHPGCYGMQYFVPASQSASAKKRALEEKAAARPKGSFKCAVCESGVLPGSARGECKICLRDCGSATPSLRGAKALVVRDPAKHPPPKPNGKNCDWVHISCAQWCNDAEFWDHEGLEHPDITNVSKERYKLSCFVCANDNPPNKYGVGGVCVQCHRSGCGNAYHFACARERRWETRVEDRDAAGIFMATYCGAHSSREFILAESTTCEVCEKDENEVELLLCEGCDRGWHIGCLSPPLKSVPEETWHCSACQANLLGGAGAAGGGTSSSLGMKRVRGVDADLPNTYFAHSKRVAGVRNPPPIPPPLPPEEVAVAGDDDTTQTPWLSAAAAADNLALATIFLPMLLAHREPCTLTLSSAGNSLPAAWHFATSFAGARRGSLMLVDMLDELCRAVGRGGGAFSASCSAAGAAAASSSSSSSSSTAVGGGGGSGGLASDISQLSLSALVVLNPAAATSLAEWGSLPYRTTDLLILPINSPQDLLVIPSELTRGRYTVHCCLESLACTPRIEAAALLRPSTRAKVATQGVAWVLRSLTRNHADLLSLVLAGVKAGKPHTQDTLLRVCRDRMIASNTVTMMGLVNELTDHGIIAHSQRDKRFLLKASAAEVEGALEQHKQG